MSDPEFDRIPEIAAEWRAAGKAVALASVVSTWGSAPRPVGSLLVVDEDGRMMGSVSGGCIEGAVVEGALETIASGEPRMMEFSVGNDRAWEVGLACGGTVKVYIDAVR